MIPNWSIMACKLFCCCNVVLGVLLAMLGAAPGAIMAQFLFAMLNAAWVWFAEWHNGRFVVAARGRKKREDER